MYMYMYQWLLSVDERIHVYTDFGFVVLSKSTSATVVPTKSDIGVIICLQLLIKTLTYTRPLQHKKICLRFNTLYGRHIYQNMYNIINVWQPFWDIFNP